MAVTLPEVRKAVTAEVTALVVWAGAAYVPDGTVTRGEWYLLAIALLSGLGIYAVPNAKSAATQLADDAQEAGYVYNDTMAAPGPGDSTPGSGAAVLVAQTPPSPPSEVVSDPSRG